MQGDCVLMESVNGFDCEFISGELLFDDGLFNAIKGRVMQVEIQAYGLILSQCKHEEGD